MFDRPDLSFSQAGSPKDMRITRSSGYSDPPEHQRQCPSPRLTPRTALASNPLYFRTEVFDPHHRRSLSLELELQERTRREFPDFIVEAPRPSLRLRTVASFASLKLSLATATTTTTTITTTTTTTSPTSPGETTPLVCHSRLKDKIVQWYCCECGQLYGGYEESPTAPEEVVLHPPVRYSCHRCDHMMCPYCPKQRLKDLVEV